jgi:hypothetical protein
VQDQWPDQEFTSYTEQLPDGQEVEMDLAERGVLLQNKGSRKKIWAREIRKKSKSGHQTAIITTNYMLSALLIGFYMFSRWSQENFFKYMMQQFGLDHLVSYLKQDISDTQTVVNPKYRELSSLLKKATSRLNIRKVKFLDMEFGQIPDDDKKAARYFEKKAELKEEIDQLQNQADHIKKEKKEVPYKIEHSELPDEQKLGNAINERKALLDNVKMIAYRAETAMANMIRHHMSHPDEARKLLREVYNSDANLWVDKKNEKLTVEIHSMSYHKNDRVIQKLCEQLNQTETVFPGTNLVLRFKMVSLQNP